MAPTGFLFKKGVRSTYLYKALGVPTPGSNHDGQTFAYNPLETQMMSLHANLTRSAAVPECRCLVSEARWRYWRTARAEVCADLPPGAAVKSARAVCGGVTGAIAAASDSDLPTHISSHPPTDRPCQPQSPPVAPMRCGATAAPLVAGMRATEASSPQERDALTRKTVDWAKKGVSQSSVCYGEETLSLLNQELIGFV